nr:hypothetical protein [Tanacetum cinerariifolium]
ESGGRCHEPCGSARRGGGLPVCRAVAAGDGFWRIDCRACRRAVVWPGESFHHPARGRQFRQFLPDIACSRRVDRLASRFQRGPAARARFSAPSVPEGSPVRLIVLSSQGNHMKRLTLLTAALALSGLADFAQAKTLETVASFTVIADMVHNVGGDHVHVTSLIGP